MRGYGWSAVLLVVALGIGCDSNDSGGGANTNTDSDTTSGADVQIVTGPVSVPITAATGGTVASASGNANLQIPAGALAGDTTIVVSELPPDGTEAPIYEFGPDGTTFLTPVTLTINFAGEVPSGKKVVVAWADAAGDTWTPITESTLTSGVVAAPVAHFTLFTLILVDGEAVLTSACEAMETFSPCGGDMIGTWTMESVCGDMFLGGNPFGDCEGATFEVDVDFDATVTIDATTIIFDLAKQTIISHLTAPKTCLPDGMQCTDIFDGQEDASCSDAGTECQCIKTDVNVGGGPETNPYTASNGIITEEDGDIIEYCVQGNTITARAVDDDGKTKLFYTLKKQ